MMRDIQEMLSRLISVFRRGRLDQDFDEEFASHIDLLTEQNVRRGLPRDEARRQAILQMGGVSATKDLHREARGLPLVERFLETLQSLTHDLIHSARSLAKARAFTFVCVVSLGVGMAPVIAVPYLARIMTKIPPPGANSDGLVELILPARGPREVTDEWSYADFVDVRDAGTGLTVAGWTGGESKTDFRTASGEQESVYTMFVSANYFDVMGVTLLQGPGFNTAVNTRQTPEPVVLVGYEFWQSRLRADPGIVGKTLTLGGIPHIVVGIVPEGFFDHTGPDNGVAVPLERHPYFIGDDNFRSNRIIEWVHIYGRLSPGVSITQVNAAIAGVTSRLAQQYPKTNEFKAGSVEAYTTMGYLGRAQMTLFQTVLFTLTGLLLVVICLNISGMMQVRSAMRERELSVRQAIGASRARLARYLLSEAVVLSVAGGSLAAFVLFNAPHVFSWWIDVPIPNDIREALRPDLVMVAVCMAVCFLASIVFGLLPALRFSRPVIITSLKDDAGVGGIRAGRTHRVTTALQVAVAVPLLVVSGIQVERVRATATADLGFESEDLYAAPLSVTAYTGEQRDFLIRSVRTNLQRADGVSSVTVATGLPLDFDGRLSRISLPDDRDTGESFSAAVTHVSDEYLETMGIPLLRGRGIAGDDVPGAELVTAISRSLAERLFPDTEAVGEQLKFIAEENAPAQMLTVIGVTEDFVTWQMTTAREQLLIPLAQHPSSPVYFVLRSAAGEQPMRLTAAFENTIREVDPDFRGAHVVTGDDLRERSSRDFITQASASGGIGGIVLALAGLGVYGIVGLTVATRRREIAVRVALGASRGRVLRMILLDVVKLVTPGVVAGLILSMALFRTEFAANGFGLSVSGLESIGYVFGAAVAILVALIAGFAPARRASSVAPMVAMRTE